MNQVEVLHPGCLDINPVQCSTYLIRLGEQCAIVDPGPGLRDAEIIEALTGFGYTQPQVAYILLTHCHVDHSLGAYRWQQGGAKLVGSRHCATALANASEQIWYEYPEYIVPTVLDTVLEGDGDLQLGSVSVRAVHTPGHTGGCYSFLVQDGSRTILLSGDLISTESQLAWSGSVDFSAADTLLSVKKLREYNPDVAYWGHGAIKEPAMAWLTRAMELGDAGRWAPPATGPAEKYHTGPPPDPSLQPYRA